MPNAIMLTDSEQDLVETLDMLIGEKAFKIAIDCLIMVEDTFSLYEHYVKKIGEAISSIVDN